MNKNKTSERGEKQECETEKLIGNNKKMKFKYKGNKNVRKEKARKSRLCMHKYV